MTAVTYAPNQPPAKVHKSLCRSLKALETAQHCAVLWFAEIQRRHLYRNLGHATINQYAMKELGFSKTRTGDFIRLTRQLDNLPAVRKALTDGELGYTKARVIVDVATPETEIAWLEATRKTRKDLIREVKRVKRAARVDPRQSELLPASPTVVSPREIPVCFQVDLTPEQEARRAALIEHLHKLGGAPKDKAELMLEALSALVESKEKAPRGAQESRPPVQIHVHQTGDTMAVPAGSGERVLSRAETERLQCDTVVSQPGKRNTATIPPRMRREVLARDRHRCRVPGCGRTRFLEVHHIVPRNKGGGHDPENLMTLCGSCHRFLHEYRRGIIPA